MQYKRGLFTLLLLLFTTLLAACAPADGEQPAAEDAGVLIYASFHPFGVDADVRLAIEAFNESHTDVQIEIRDYWGGDYEEGLQGRQRLITEISTGNMPDILDVGFNCWDVPMLPWRQLAARGYLVDLWPYIESDPELGREAVLEAPLKAAEIDGGLYILFDSFTMQTLAGAERIVGNRTSWTLADQRKAFEAMPEGSTVLDYIYKKDDVSEILLSMMLDSYIDWEAGTCSFDKKSFRTMLEFIEGFPDEVPWPSDEAVNFEILDRRRSGLQMLYVASVSNLFDVQYMDAIFGEPTSFVGYPVEDGSVGSAFEPSNTRLVISASCKNKEAAWEIVRQTILPKYDRAEAARKADGIPINMADYRMVNETLMDPDRPTDQVFGFIDGSTFEAHPATVEDLQRFEELLYGINRISLCDGELSAIVKEICGPYFAGDKTLDETVDLIQRRVTLYVNENR